MATIYCDKCGDECKPTSPITTGYGTLRLPDGSEQRHCYKCCGETDKQAMLDDGKAWLYLSNGKITKLATCNA